MANICFSLNKLRCILKITINQLSVPSKNPNIFALHRVCQIVVWCSAVFIPERPCSSYFVHVHREKHAWTRVAKIGLRPDEKVPRILWLGVVGTCPRLSEHRKSKSDLGRFFWFSGLFLMNILYDFIIYPNVCSHANKYA